MPLEMLEARELLATIAVVNTADSGPGSLRQAILDANTLAGPDFIEFDIPVSNASSEVDFVTKAGLDCDSTNNGLADSSPCWWLITLLSPLPSLTDDGTEIRGLTQPHNTNPDNVGTITTVGTGITALTQKPGPEIAINGNDFNAITVSGGATGIVIEGMAIYNSANAIVVTTGTTSEPAAVVRNMLIGTLPDGTEPEDPDKNTLNGVEVQDLAQVFVTNSFVGFNGQSGIAGLSNESVLHLTFNEVFGNGWNSQSHSGIDLAGIDSEIQANYVHDNTNNVNSPRADSGHGIALGRQTAGTGHILVEHNTISDNMSAGMAVRGGPSGNTISRNVVTGNAVGIVVAIENATATDGNEITLNRIANNGAPGTSGLGIDLVENTAVTLGDGVTKNDEDDADDGSNGLANFPVLVTALISGSNLIVSGFAEPGTVLELYVAAADTTGFGEGDTLIVSRTEGSADDTDAGTGLYGPIVNSHEVAAGSVQSNRFRFVLPLGSLPVAIPEGTVITATGTVSGSTSEFGPIVSVALDPGSLSGFVYHDLDDDGVLDAGEQGISDVLVTLTGTNDLGAAVNLTARTENDGSYAFDSLRPGVYQIAESQPVGLADGKDTLGTLDGEQVNDRFFNIVVLTGQHGTDYNFAELDTLPDSSVEHTVRVFAATEQWVQVRVLSRRGFDPRDMNRDTVRLGNAIVRKYRVGGDLNKDGRRDVVLYFRANETGLAVGDETVRLRGRFTDGRAFALDLAVEVLAVEDVKIGRRPGGR